MNKLELSNLSKSELINIILNKKPKPSNKYQKLLQNWPILLQKKKEQKIKKRGKTN